MADNNHLSAAHDIRNDQRIAETLTFRLLLAANLTAKPFQERFGDRLNISLAEWRCIMALTISPGRSGQEVSASMGMDPMNVSRCLRKLEKKTYVRRQPDPENRKRNSWFLTDEGWAVFDEILPEAIRRDREIFGGISGEERQVIFRVLDRFIARAAQENDSSL